MTHVAPVHLEEAEQGLTELALVAVRYTGDRSIIPTQTLRAQGKWPGPNGIVADTWYVALVPDQGLAHFEGNANIEVAYDREAIAEALLSKTTLPASVFGRNATKQVQEHVFDHLGLEHVGLGEDRYSDYREQLRDIVPEDVDEDITEGEPERKTVLLEQTRSELQEQAKELGYDDDLRGASKTDLATYIAEAEG